VAAERKLHTSQPSLSRQIRDLENEVGAQLLMRTARGIELTPAGRAFLDHARSVLSQVEAATEAARRVAHPAKPCFSMGFLTGQPRQPFRPGCPDGHKSVSLDVRVSAFAFFRGMSRALPSPPAHAKPRPIPVGVPLEANRLTRGLVVRRVRDRFRTRDA
jgi:hypothetical protein